MRVRVVLTRTVQQYADVEVTDVESPEAAALQIETQLKHPASRARLLRGLGWYGDGVVEEVGIELAEDLDEPSGHA